MASDRYVFPDGELMPVSLSSRVAEEVGFEVWDIESLREHYALALPSIGQNSTITLRF